MYEAERLLYACNAPDTSPEGTEEVRSDVASQQEKEPKPDFFCFFPSSFFKFGNNDNITEHWQAHARRWRLDALTLTSLGLAQSLCVVLHSLGELLRLEELVPCAPQAETAQTTLRHSRMVQHTVLRRERRCYTGRKVYRAPRGLTLSGGMKKRCSHEGAVAASEPWPHWHSAPLTLLPLLVPHWRGRSIPAAPAPSRPSRVRSASSGCPECGAPSGPAPRTHTRHKPITVLRDSRASTDSGARAPGAGGARALGAGGARALGAGGARALGAGGARAPGAGGARAPGEGGPSPHLVEGLNGGVVVRRRLGHLGRTPSPFWPAHAR